MSKSKSHHFKPTTSIDIEDNGADDIPADDLDEVESGVYLCRWPNGDFSVVKADSRHEAILDLDEWDGAHADWLLPLDNCMIDFRINDQGEFELVQFGHETADFVRRTCYPFLDAALSSDDVLAYRSGEGTPAAAEKILRAVECERERLRRRGTEQMEAHTEVGRTLQRMLGTAGPVADHYVAQAARQILRSKSRSKGKPN